MAAKPLFRLIAEAVHAELETILRLEGRAVPELVFGNREFKEFDRTVRVEWTHAKGSFVLGDVPDITAPDDPPATVLAARKAFARITIFDASDERAERVLDRLVLAFSQVDLYSKVPRWDEASYEYRSEVVGESLKNGVAIIVLSLPLMLPVAGEPEGETETVTVDDTEVRAGIESPIGEDEADTAYEVNEWVDPDQHSES